MTRDEIIAAYQAAIAAHNEADKELNRLLVARYGKRRCYVAAWRYRPAETVEIAQAMRRKLEASAEQQRTWLATMCRHNNMVERKDDQVYAWQCECGYVFGKESSEQ